MTHTSEATRSYIMVFNVLDGTLVNKIYYSLGQTVYPLYTRNILLGTGVSGTYKAYVHTTREDAVGLYGF
jgi:hypothetical protein